MRRKRKIEPLVLVLATVLVILVGVTAMLGVSYVQLSEKETETAITLSDAEKEIAAYERLISQYEQNVENLKEQINTLGNEADELQAAIERLTDEKTAESEILTQYADRLTDVQSLLQVKEAELADSVDMLDKFKKLVSNNHGYYSDKIAELYRVLNEDAPDRIRIFFPETEEGETLSPETDPEEAVPVLSYLYCDLSTGYTIAYNEKEIRYSASLIKAPYIYSVLLEIEEFEENKRNFTVDGEPLYDEDGEPLFEGDHPNFDEDGKIIYLPGEEKYDLSREWVYDEDTMFQDGSGEIQNMENGVKMTYRDLVEYALVYSDNIAFSELRRVFGYATYYELAEELQIDGRKYAFMELSAEDCGKFLTEFYRYFETETEYALMMKECMIRSLHTVMIVNPLYGTPVAHKYGWDTEAYHDMGIVLGEHPYLLVIMTNLEQGGSEVNAYVSKLVKLTDEIHKSHYSD